MTGATGRPRQRPDRLLADKGYPSRANRAWLREHGIATTIPERDDQIATAAKRPGRPIDFRQDRPQPPLRSVPRRHTPLGPEPLATRPKLGRRVDLCAPTKTYVQELLSHSYGFEVVIADADHLAPWSVLRARLTPAPGLPASVIVKWLRDHPTGFRTDPRQVHTERAALEFLTGRGLQVAPQLVASDLAAGILVLEDLSPRVPLDQLIRRDGAVRCEAGLSAFARMLGELAAETAGRAGMYYAKRATYGPTAPGAELEHVLGPRWSETRLRLDGLGAPISGAADTDLATLLETLSRPGPFLAFTNGDTAANNFLVDGREGRFIDFEFAGYRHALTTAAWIHVPGPAWMRVADPNAEYLEVTFRKALSHGVPEADDDNQFALGMAAACLAMAFERLNRLPHLDERAPGDKSRVQMVSTLEAAAEVAERHGSLPHLTGWTRRVEQLLRRRWADADVDLGRYPSYAPRG